MLNVWGLQKKGQTTPKRHWAIPMISWIYIFCFNLSCTGTRPSTRGVRHPSLVSLLSLYQILNMKNSSWLNLNLMKITKMETKTIKQCCSLDGHKSSQNHHGLWLPAMVSSGVFHIPVAVWLLLHLKGKKGINFQRHVSNFDDPAAIKQGCYKGSQEIYYDSWIIFSNEWL